MSDARRMNYNEKNEEEEAAKAAAEVLAALSGGGIRAFPSFELGSGMINGSGHVSRNSRDSNAPASGGGGRRIGGAGGKNDNAHNMDRSTKRSSSCESASATSTIAAATTSTTNGSDSKRSFSPDDGQVRTKNGGNDILGFGKAITFKTRSDSNGRDDEERVCSAKGKGNRLEGKSGEAGEEPFVHLDGRVPSEEKRKKKRKDKKKKRKFRDAVTADERSQLGDDTVVSGKKTGYVGSLSDYLESSCKSPSKVQDHFKLSNGLEEAEDVPLCKPSRVASVQKRSKRDGQEDEQTRFQDSTTKWKKEPVKKNRPNSQVKGRMKSSNLLSKTMEMPNQDRFKSPRDLNERVDVSEQKSFQLPLGLAEGASDQGQILSSHRSGQSPIEVMSTPHRATNIPKTGGNGEQRGQTSFSTINGEQSKKTEADVMNQTCSSSDFIEQAKIQQQQTSRRAPTLPSSASAAMPDSGSDMWGVLYQQLLQQFMSLPQQQQQPPSQQQPGLQQEQADPRILNNWASASGVNSNAEDKTLSLVQDMVNELFQNFRAPSNKGNNQNDALLEQATPQQFQNTFSLLEQQVHKLQAQEQVRNAQRFHQQQLQLQQQQWHQRQKLNVQEQHPLFHSTAIQQMGQEKNLQQMLLQYQQIMNQQQKQVAVNMPSPTHHRSTVMSGFSGAAQKPGQMFAMQQDALQQRFNRPGHQQQQQQQITMQNNNTASRQGQACDPFTAALASLVQNSTTQLVQQPMQHMGRNKQPVQNEGVHKKMVLPQEQLLALVNQASKQANPCIPQQSALQQQVQTQSDNSQDQANVLLNSLLSLLQPTPAT